MPGHSFVRAGQSLLLIVLLLAAGCATSAPEEAAEPVVTATIAPTQTPEAIAALLPTVTPTEETSIEETSTEEPLTVPPDWTQFAVQEGDYYVLGNPNAPVRMIDYSDFL